MAAHSDKKVIIAALIGNGCIAIMKFAVAVLSGSAAMLAEGFHSVADTGNQIMLLVGQNRSKRPPDERHPFGYAKEIYFWAFAVAVSMFFIGAGLSIYEGVKKLIHPEPIRTLHLPLIVLGLSVLLEAYPWLIAFKAAKKIKRKQGFSGYLDMMSRSKNPVVMVVLIEDSAAMIGLVVAGIGITLAHQTGMPVFDALASIVIGILLFFVAIILARETKELLIGESATKKDRARIMEVLKAVPEISVCGSLLTMHLGPDDILVNLDVEFADRLSTDELEAVIDKIETGIREAVPAVKKIYIEAESIRQRKR
ncbi:cation diffusion facilitator family transporter [Acidobacteriota bacterium]